ncbi:MAG: putative Zn finger-like uncharacterized protein [Myxococcota bacterium]|jgi:predicted Zn finger-like uncharacterized protein
MRVVCDNCGAQYKIPDQKLVKDVNKATCRKCGHRMLIHRPAASMPRTMPRAGDEEGTLITSSEDIARQAAQQAAAASRVLEEQAYSEEWDDDGPTKVRDFEEPDFEDEDDIRPTSPGMMDFNSEPTQTISEPPPPVRQRPPQVRSVTPQAPRPPSAPIPAPIVRGGYDPTADMGWVTLGTLAAIAGALLLGANLADNAIQRFIGVLFSLGGGSVALLILFSGARGGRKANVLLSVALSVILSTSGAVAMHLLHTGYDAWSGLSAPLPVAPPRAPDVVPLPEPEPIAATDENSGAQDLLADAPSPEEPTPTAPQPETTPAAPEPVREPTTRAPPTETPGPSTSSRPEPAPEPSALPPRAPEPEPPPEAAPPQSTASSVLLPTVIDTMLRNNSTVKTCFQMEYKRAGTLPSSLPITFKVQSSGRVSAMWTGSSDYKDSSLESCLRSALYEIRFPPFEGPTETKSYTFRIR